VAEGGLALMIGLPIMIIIAKVGENLSGLSGTASNTIIGVYILTALMWAIQKMGSKGSEWNL